MLTPKLYNLILSLCSENKFCIFRGGFNKQDCLWRVFVGEDEKFIHNAANLDLLNNFLSSNKNRFIYGYITYDLKNQFEKLHSNKKSHIGFPLAEFIVPSRVISFFENGSIETLLNKTGEKEISTNDFDEINSIRETKQSISLEQAVLKEEYMADVKKIKYHIQQGDVYELNYCMEMISDDAEINPSDVFKNLLEKTDAPFSCLMKTGNKYLICASPERFLLRQGSKIIAQPMKGTAPRNTDVLIDEQNKLALTSSDKERAENIMITDLVRNDLSKIAKPKSVHVEELCKVYEFKNVFQMISTVACEIKDDVSFSEILKATFPMGSMTGAPKVRAMQLIDELEKSSRGIFSGSIGYFIPGGDFDFNVIIRSIIYDEMEKRVSVFAGSAITSNSIPELEYEECLLKMKAMVESLI